MIEFLQINIAFEKKLLRVLRMKYDYYDPECLKKVNQITALKNQLKKLLGNELKSA